MIDLDEARRILAEAGWRSDMENAPRDGTRIDLWLHYPEGDRQARYADCYWEPEFNDWRLGQYRITQYLYPPTPLFWKPLDTPDTPPPLHALCESLIADNEAQARRIEAMEAENAELKSARRARIAATYLKETPDE